MAGKIPIPAQDVISPDDLDPQSAAAAAGMAKIGQAAVESEPVQNAITGKGLDNYGQMMRGAIAGDPGAQDQLANHSLGMAMGTMQDVSKGGKLAMDEASRTARAAEAGFDTSKTLYHGTTADIGAFADKRAANGRAYGDGVYLAERPQDASGYANKTVKGKMSEVGGNVMPVHTNYSKPFNLDADLDPALKDLILSDPSLKKVHKMIKDEDSNFGLYGKLINSLPPAKFTELLKSAGYDALEAPHVKTTVVFDPANIRSKFAEHDPAKAGKNGLSFAEGGPVPGANGSMINYESMSPGAQDVGTVSGLDQGPSPIDQQSSDVNVYNPEGKLVSIPAEHLSGAMEMGYRQATPQEVEAQYHTDKYGSAGQQAITGLEGVGSGVLGSTISSGLERAAGVPTEDIRGREETNPGTHLAGEVAGFAGSALAGTGEAAILGKAGEAIGAASGLTQAAKLGGWQTRVAADAVKGAFENALYQADQELGRAVKEDPEVGAGHAIASIGLAGVAGGVFGGAIGAGLRKIGAHPDFPSSMPEEAFVSSADAAKYEAGDLKTHVEVDPTLAPKKKEGLLEAFKLNKQKGNAKEIETARKVLGAPETPGMLLESPLIGMQVDSLAHSPYTYSGNKIRTQLDTAYNAATGALEAATKSANGLSKDEMGQSLQASLSKDIQDAYAPVKAAYEGLTELHPNVPVSINDIASFKAGLQDIKELKLGATTAEGKLARTVVSALQNAKTAEDITTIRNMSDLKYSGMGADPLGHIKGVLRDKLQDLQDSAVMKYAKSFPRNDEAGALMSSLIDQNVAAKEAYTPYIKKVKELAEGLGKKKIYGTMDALNYLNERLSPSDVAGKLFSANKDPQFIKFFSREFPEQFKQVRDYQRMAMREAATTGDEFSPKRFFTAYDKLEPEIQKALYTKDEMAKINAANTYIKEAFPKDYNPSHTSHALALKEAYGSPKGMALANARDFAMEQVIKAASPKLSQAQALADATVKGDKLSTKAVKAIFNPAKDAMPAAVIPLAAHREKLMKIVAGYQADPSKMLGQNDNNPLPTYAQSFSSTTARAVQLLAAAKPQTAPKNPLDTQRQPSKEEESKYNRTLDIAQQPLNVLARIKSNTLTSSDVLTLKTLYPTVYNGLSQKIMNEVVSAKDKGIAIPYSTRMQLSVFLGQPLDSTMTQPFMAAAQAKPLAQQEKESQGGGGKPSSRGPSSQGMKSLDKLAPMAQTSSQARVRDRSDGKL